jgi:ankyrin repeat protein
MLILINAGADINHQDSLGNTPLHYSSQNGQKKTLSILLKRFSINTKILNNDGVKAEERA